MSNFQDSKTTIIIATISVIGTVIATLGNAVISNWQQILPHEKTSSSEELLTSENSQLQNTEIEKKQEIKPVKSSKQFERLENFVKQGEWVKADLELDLLQPQYLTCSQLSDIAQIYYNYSDGTFGYRVQRDLWDSKEVNKDYKKFSEFVGWKQKENYIYNINDPKMITGIDAQNKAKAGHLPFNGWQVKGINRQNFNKFMDKLRQCNI
jgi:hypothetical protein